jgi:hypothetical protein
VLIATVLGLGVNLVAGSLLQLRVVSDPAALILGGLLVLGSLVWVLLLSFGARTFRKEYEGLFLINRRTNGLMRIPEYRFCEELCTVIEAVLTENKAFMHMWNEEPLVRDDGESTVAARKGETSDEAKAPGATKPGYVSITRVERDVTAAEPKSAALVREAIEYVLLGELSLHLSSYFNSYPHEDSYVREYQRKDIPTLLLENRVLALLTKPMEEREPFIKAFSPKKGGPEGEVHVLYSADGAMYRRFDLALPAGTKISRPSAGTLILDNNRIRLEIRAQYEGFSAVVPFDFLDLYLGVDPFSVAPRMVRVFVEYRVKAWSLTRRSGWEYYQWVDSFVERLQGHVSADAFFHNISWDALSAYFRVMQKRGPGRGGGNRAS